MPAYFESFCNFSLLTHTKRNSNPTANSHEFTIFKALVNSGYLTMEILLNNLEHAARTLEALFAVESGFEEQQVVYFGGTF